MSQAIHWFDIPKFYSEADRILKSKGVLAIFGYCLPVIEGSAEMEKLIEKVIKLFILHLE